jgi:hypothetical protein
MTQVSEVSRQYATGSKQTAAASSQIATLAAAMQDSISTFQVDGSDAVRGDQDFVDPYADVEAGQDLEDEADEVPVHDDEGVSLH